MSSTILKDKVPLAAWGSSLELKFLAGPGLGVRQIRVLASDATPDRAGDILEPLGCKTAEFRKNPVVLWQHDRTIPVGTAEVVAKSSHIEAIITFAPEGASGRADECFGLVRAGVLRAVSVGLIQLAKTPIKGGGWRITEWTLLEISFVTIPANPNAIILESSLVESQRAERIKLVEAAQERWRLIEAARVPPRSPILERAERMRLVQAARDRLRLIEAAPERRRLVEAARRSP